MVRSCKRDPVGIQTQDLQNFFWPHSAKWKKGEAVCGHSPFLRDPVGIQPQDLQDFFWPHLAKWKKESPFVGTPLSFSDPVGIQTQDLQNRNLTLYSAKLRDHHTR